MYSTLISVNELAELLASDAGADANIVLLDCRFDLANPDKGRMAYGAGHLPGAIYADLNRDLSAPVVPGETGRHPLPNVETFAAQLGAWGIDKDTQVVAYDDSGGSYAARLWWMLRWLGHDAVAVLDGGWKAWTRAEHPTDTAVPQPKPRTFTPKVRTQMVATAEEVRAAIDDGGSALLDARAADRFRGENETIDPVGGHIPTACNAPWMGNLDSEGYLLPPEALRARFTRSLAGSALPEDALPDDILESRPVIAYCGSGVTAAHNLLAMTVAGIENARLYPGSWSEWITDPARPTAQGS